MDGLGTRAGAAADADFSQRVCAYLRKSRKDRDTDWDGNKLSDEDILARQQQLCDDLASRNGLVIAHYYRDVKSGETLADRPEASAMFSAIVRGEWDAVVTVEVERLGRGNQGDQGRIVSALKGSAQLGSGGCRVITMTKTYYPDSEADMDYIEFGLFMSSRELSTITRRLSRGKTASVVSGQYIATFAPYGYDKVTLGGTKTLEPNADAKVVALVFGMGASGMTTGGIARGLDHMAIPSATGGGWKKESVNRMLHNEVYLGLVRWGRTRTMVSADKALNLHKRRVYRTDYDLIDGLHLPIVDRELFEAARSAIQARRPVGRKSRLVDPFAGLVRCSSCRQKMGIIWDRQRGEHRITHRDKREPCGVPSSAWDPFHAAVLAALCDERSRVCRSLESPDLRTRKAVAQEQERRCAKEIAEAERGLRLAFELLDEGRIGIDEFALRHGELVEKKDEAIARRDGLADEESDESLRAQLRLLDKAIAKLGDGESDAAERNRALRRVVERIDYVCDAPARTVKPPFKVSVKLKAAPN